jgi:hypothetical protein
MVIWYILPALVCCTKKNLATLRPGVILSRRSNARVSKKKFQEVAEILSFLSTVITQNIFPQGDQMSLLENRPKCGLTHFWSKLGNALHLL